MASCYWAQPGQLHPWYKLDTLKRKLPEMFPRSESPSPVDEYDSDPRAKRQRRTTLDQMRSMKRKLPSPPQSPVDEESGPDDTRLFKRQRCTTLERGIESLSLAAPPPPTAVQAHAALASSTTTLTPAPQAQTAPEFNAPLLLPPLTASPVTVIPVDEHQHHITLDHPSSLQPPLPPSLYPTQTPITSASSALSDADAITDVKMHSSSWYEPQKDRACLFFFSMLLVVGPHEAVLLTDMSLPPAPIPNLAHAFRSLFSFLAIGIIVTDLDASSDDEADIVDVAPKLPRSVLQALLRGPNRANAPFPGLLLSPVLPQLASQLLDPPTLHALDPGSLFEPGLDDAMDVEQ